MRLKLYITLLALSSAPLTSFAAISLDASGSYSSASQASPRNVSLTLSDIQNPMVVCGWWGNNADITGITFDGLAMTKYSQIGTGSERLFIFAATGTSVNGAKTVSVSYSGTVLTLGGCAAYSGVDQNTLGISGTSASGTGTAVSVHSTSTADGGWAFGFVRNESGASYAAGAGTTQITTIGGSEAAIYDTTPVSPQAAGSNITINATMGSSVNWRANEILFYESATESSTATSTPASTQETLVWLSAIWIMVLSFWCMVFFLKKRV